MKDFSIQKARKILGKLAKDVSDEQIQRDIDVAVILKDMFFEMQVRNKKKDTKTPPNVP